MKSLEDVLAELGSLNRSELLAWVEASWVRPEPDDGGFRFRQIDVARLRLICELRDELAIDPEAMPVVLSLLDKVYGLRRRLCALARALAEASPEVRSTVFTRCRILLSELEENDEAERHA